MTIRQTFEKLLGKHWRKPREPDEPRTADQRLRDIAKTL